MQIISIAPSIVDGSFSSTFIDLFQNEKYTQDFVGYSNSTMSEEVPSLFNAFNIASFVLTGSYLNLDENTIAVKSKNGAFSQLYFPSVCLKDNTFGIRWGKDVKPLTLFVKETEIEVGPNKYTVSTVIDSYKDAYGDQPSLCLKVLNKAKKALIKVFFPLNRADVKAEFKISDLKDAFEADPNSLLSILSEPKSFTPFTKLGHTPVGSYTATKVEGKVGTFGLQYYITLHSDEPVEVQFTNSDKELVTKAVTDWQVTSNTSLNPIIARHLERFPDGNLPQGSTLTIYSVSVKQGKTFAEAGLFINYPDNTPLEVPTFDF